MENTARGAVSFVVLAYLSHSRARSWLLLLCSFSFPILTCFFFWKKTAPLSPTAHWHGVFKILTSKLFSRSVIVFSRFNHKYYFNAGNKRLFCILLKNSISYILITIKSVDNANKIDETLSLYYK